MSSHSSLISVVIFSLSGFQLPHLYLSTAYPSVFQLTRHKELAKVPLSNLATHPPLLHCQLLHLLLAPLGASTSSNSQPFPLPRLSEKAPPVNKAAVSPHATSSLILLTSNSPKCCSSEQPKRSVTFIEVNFFHPLCLLHQLQSSAFRAKILQFCF